MSYKEQLERYKEQLNVLKQIENDLTQDFKLDLTEKLKEFFDKHENVNSFYITGYTPSFNDGDPCTFNLNADIDCSMVDLDGNEIDIYDDLNISLKEDSRKLSSFLNSLPTDEMWCKIADMDYFKITFNRSGKMDVEEYWD